MLAEPLTCSWTAEVEIDGHWYELTSADRTRPTMWTTRGLAEKFAELAHEETSCAVRIVRHDPPGHAI